MSRTYKKGGIAQSHRSPWKESFNGRMQLLRNMEEWNKYGKKVRSKKVPDDPYWNEPTFSPEYDIGDKVALKLARKQWGFARIARQLQKKFGLSYFVAEEKAKRAVDDYSYEKARQVSHVSRKKRDRLKKENAEAKQKKLAQQRQEKLKLQKAEEKKVALENLDKCTDGTVRSLKDIWKGKTISKELGSVVTWLKSGEYEPALQLLEHMPNIRSISSWNPVRKSRRSSFYSLCQHLMGTYNVPSFLWNALLEPHPVLHEMVRKIANGESLYGLCKSGEFPVPLTKHECHTFLQPHPEEWNVIYALRYSQMGKFGNQTRLLDAIISSSIGRELGDRAEEKISKEIIKWFCRQSMFDFVYLSPIADYLKNRMMGDPQFDLSGRTIRSLYRLTQRWHEYLAIENGDYSKVKFFPSNGFVPSHWQSDSWTIDEILSRETLRNEGSKMKHCVYSYVGSIATRKKSIWSLKDNGRNCLTIEVYNIDKAVVQIRGKCNRLPTEREVTIVKQWAAESSLRITAYMG